MVTALLGAHDLTGRHLHEPAPRADQRADLPQRRADLATTALAAVLTDLAGHRGAARPPAVLLRAAHGGGVPVVLRRGGGGRRRRGRACSGGGTPPTSSTAIVAVLTNVGHDHTDGQGDWRRRIAEEKAGIVKEGATFVLGETDPGAGRRLRRARPRRRCGGATSTSPASRTGSPSAAGCSTCARRAAPTTRCSSPLHGAHQGENAAIALAAAEAFFGRPLDAGPRGRGLRGRAQPGSVRGRAARPAAHPRRRPQPRRRASPPPRRSPRGSSSPATPPRHRRARRARPGRAPRDPRRRGRGRGRLLHARLAAGAARRRARRARPPRSAVGPSWSTTSATRSSAALAAADADDVVLVTGSLYTVGAARAACRRLGSGHVTASSALVALRAP